MKKKYEITDESRIIRDYWTVYRIRALRDIPAQGVKAGNLGGWIASEENLTQEGDAWVGGNAAVYDRAQVSGAAYVCGPETEVWGGAQITDNAQVDGCATVRDHSVMGGHSHVSDYAWVCNAVLRDSASLWRNAQVYNGSVVAGDAIITDQAHVHDGAVVDGTARIFGSANIFGGHISTTKDYWTAGPIGTWGITLTFQRKDSGLFVNSEDFRGLSAEEFPSAENLRPETQRSYFAVLRLARRFLLAPEEG